MKHLLFIYNPTAGKGQIAEHLSQILNIFTKEGWLVTTYPTQTKGDATRIARELGPQFDRVVCAGGDGTLSETVSGLVGLESPPVLGYIPIGSTNDCAKNLRLPANAVEGEKKTFRTLSIDGEEFEFSQGFTELHTESYRQILAGNGFRISEARSSIEIVSAIRHAQPIGLVGDYHPLAKLPLAKHPFGWDEKR